MSKGNAGDDWTDEVTNEIFLANPNAPLQNKRFTDEFSFSPPPCPPPAISLINSLVLIAPVKDQAQGMAQ